MPDLGKFKIDETYSIPLEDTAPQLDCAADETTNQVFSTFMAHQDGSCSARTRVHSSQDYSFRREAIAVLADGQIAYNDITADVGGLTETNAFGYQGGVFLLIRHDTLKYFPDKGLGKATQFEIPHNKEKFEMLTGVSRCPDGVVAVAFNSVIIPFRIGFLNVTTDPLGAAWVPWPDDPKSGIMDRLRLLARFQTPLNALTVKNTLPSCAVVYDGAPYVFSHPGWINRGYNNASLNKMRPNGRIEKRLYFEDFYDVPDNKKRGRNALFSSCGRYCCLESTYQSTDPWKGKQKFFDLQENDLFSFELPRGYTKYRFVDHNGGYFWFSIKDHKNRVTHVARAQIAQ